MTGRRATLAATSLLLLSIGALPGQSGREVPEECTIGAAIGSATTDGRPMIWKTRDWSEINNEVHWYDSMKYRFISVGNAVPLSTLMGLNEHGFAILNSASADLKSGRRGLGNGTFMHMALGSCATLVDLEDLLESTNRSGRTTRANFAVMDSTGRVAIYETAGTEYWKYDAADPQIAPHGYVLRTNFAENGGGQGGIDRYRRTVKLVAEMHAENNLNYRSILRVQMRDFSDGEGETVPVPFPRKWQPDKPFGLIYTGSSICRSSSVSAAVFLGILPGEPAELSTMWTILGQPAVSITVPYWPVGPVPSVADGPRTAPLCDEAIRIRSLVFGSGINRNYLDSYVLRDEEGDGLWSMTFAAEDSIFEATDLLLQQWRVNMPSYSTMLETEKALAIYAYSKLKAYKPD